MKSCFFHSRAWKFAGALALVAAIMCTAGNSLAYAYDIILDSGHTPTQPGAISCSGQKEVVYNDELLKVVKDQLEKKNIQVDITRAPGQEMGLMERAGKSEGKKLFISLHHDSVQPRYMKQINGNPVSQKGRGYSIFVSRKNPEFEKSLEYAKILGRSLRTAGLKPSTHHGENIKGENRELLDKNLGIYAHDDLIVLKHSKSPALLLESAVIVHPQDERAARSDSHRQAIAKAIEETARAVKDISQKTR